MRAVVPLERNVRLSGRLVGGQGNNSPHCTAVVVQLTSQTIGWLLAPHLRSTDEIGRRRGTRQEQNGE